MFSMNKVDNLHEASHYTTRTLPRTARRIILGCIPIFTAAIFITDLYFPLGYTVPILYILPLFLTVYLTHRGLPFFVAAAATVLSIVAIDLSPPGFLQAAYFNRALVGFLMFTLALLISYHIHLTRVLQIRTEALLNSVRVVRSFFEGNAVMMGIVELCGEEIIHRADNFAAAQFLGKTPEDMRNRSASELGVPPEVQREWIRQCQESVRLNKPITVEYARTYPLNPRQPPHSISLTISYIGTSSTQNPLFSFIKEDITETASRLERVQTRSPGQFVSSIP